MESSSSNDSFLWSEASDDTINMSAKFNTSESEEDWESDTRRELLVGDSILENNNKGTHKKHSKTKKRKEPESGHDYKPDKKRIKLEPESDIDKQKKKNIGDDIYKNNLKSHNTVLDYEGYPNVLVKQEQQSLISPEVIKLKKKKKHKKSIVNNSCEIESLVDLDNNDVKHSLDVTVKEEVVSSSAPKVMQSKKRHKYSKSDIDDTILDLQPDVEASDNELKNYINLRVKEEQASLADMDLTTKLKRKKKSKRSVNSNIENSTEAKSTHLNYTAIEIDTIPYDEKTNVEYPIIQEKFPTAEAVVENQKKKKLTKEAHNIFSEERNENVNIVSKESSDENTCNDLTLQPNDFTCNNVSSTIINNSIVDTINDTKEQIMGNTQQSKKKPDNSNIKDDEMSSYCSLETNSKSSNLKRFLQSNPHLQIAPKTQNNCILTEDDDIWILKCPHGMDCKRLKSTYLSLDDKCKIKIDGERYDGVPSKDSTSLTIVTYKNGQAFITNLPVKGYVNYRKRIPKNHIPGNINIVSNETNFIPLPNTKCRHPLLGANYKKALKIPANVAERLHAAKVRQVSSCEGIMNKRYKTVKKRVEDIPVEEECKPELEILNKKRKKKQSQETAAPYKKRKNKKHHRDNTEAWESEKAIEENLFNIDKY